MYSIYSPFNSPTLQSTGQIPKQTERTHLLGDAVRKHDSPSPERGVLLGMESGVCAHMCVGIFPFLGQCCRSFHQDIVGRYLERRWEESGIK